MLIVYYGLLVAILIITVFLIGYAIKEASISSALGGLLTLVIFIFGIIFDGQAIEVITNPDTTTIPDEAEMFNGSYYKVYNTIMSWHEAKEYAEALGGHLATINSQDEQSFIESLIQGEYKQEYWLGGTDEVQEGEWVWVTGEPFTFTNWASGEPNNSGGIEHYLIIINTWSNLNLFGLWNDGTADGSNSIGFIVEWISPQ